MEFTERENTILTRALSGYVADCRTLADDDPDPRIKKYWLGVADEASALEARIESE